jgi:metal-responsive CopG/Arc/MetJ family transcriptional regulator
MAKTPGTKQLSVEIPVELLKEFNAEVKRQGLTNKTVVEQLVREWLKAQERLNINL